MSTSDYDRAYRRGTIFGLTIAEMLILLLFALLLLFLPTIIAERSDDDYLKEIEQLKLQQRNSFDDIEVLTQEVNRLQRQYENVLENQSPSEAEMQSIAEELEALRIEHAKLVDTHRILSVKGQNPPCWYSEVLSEQGLKREKPHYIFDVAVFDEYIDVRLRDAPIGGAFDDSTKSYAEELGQLGLSDIPFGNSISDSEFTDYFRPLFELGKNGHVRSYSCIFSISVWDETSPNAKARWKRANGELLQGYFGTYLVRDLPWPYENTNKSDVPHSDVSH